MRSFTAAYDLDRDASRVAVREGAPIGLANLGLRGADAWIGGLGVVPGERRRGTGRALMRAVHDEARARGAAQVWLEVIAENTGARALYEELGYKLVRDLVVWSLVGGADGVAPEVPAAEAHAWIRAHRSGREPWQRDDASLARIDEPRGLAVDGAAAVVRVTGARVRRRAGRRRGGRARGAARRSAHAGRPPRRPQSARGRRGRGCPRAARCERRRQAARDGAAALGAAHAHGRASQYVGRPRSGRSNGAYACFGSGVSSSAEAP